MQYVYGTIGVIFSVLALLHVPHPTPGLWVPYSGGAILAFLNLVPSMSTLVARALAIAATALLFFFFAGFFMEVPKLETGWYQSQEGWSAVSLLVAAFTLIPVLSDYSCRCKADCREARAESRQTSHRGFFSAPQHSRPRSY